MAPPGLSYRPAIESDHAFLRTMLTAAFNWRDDPEFDDALLATPEAAHYVDGWQRDADFGVIAERDGEPAGATWARQLTAADPGYGYVADTIPELTLAVAPAHRGRRIGSHLLEALVVHATERGLTGLSLSVEDGNHARELYRRVGFTVVGREGGSDTMLLRLPSRRPDPAAPDAPARHVPLSPQADVSGITDTGA